MELFNPKSLNFQFVKSFKFFVPFSFTMFLICLFGMFVKPGIKYGIDFRGGIESTVAVKSAEVTSAQLRNLLESKIEGLSIVESKSLKEGFAKEFLITGATQKKEDVAAALTQQLNSIGAKDQDWTIVKTDSVGAKVGSELRKSALMSLIYTAILIALYMYVRFDMRYSPGAIVGVLHDLVFTCGFLVLIGTEFSTEVVAALLTLAGYSINDTVVVFDRIREIEQTMFGKSKAWIVDHALNTTLSRTFITGGTTILCLIVLFFVGGASLRAFSVTLLFGIIVGTYSSVYVAAPLYLWGDKIWGDSTQKSETASNKPSTKSVSKMKEAKV